MATITKIEKVREDNYLVTSLPCPMCTETLVTPMSGTHLYGYHQGLSISLIFPDLPARERERFISGYCPACWASLFGGWD